MFCKFLIGKHYGGGEGGKAPVADIGPQVSSWKLQGERLCSGFNWLRVGSSGGDFGPQFRIFVLYKTKEIRWFTTPTAKQPPAMKQIKQDDDVTVGSFGLKYGAVHHLAPPSLVLCPSSQLWAQRLKVTPRNFSFIQQFDATVRVSVRTATKRLN